MRTTELENLRLSDAWRNCLPEDAVERFAEHLEFEPHDSIIDPLIEPVVRVLQEHGIHTVESCQGTTGHYAADYMGGFAWVQFRGSPAESLRATALALEYGWPIRHLKQSWSVNKWGLDQPHWEMTFYPISRGP